ncbi:MAG: hypothetical protein AB3N12_13470 [Ruegeria sp.]
MRQTHDQADSKLPFEIPGWAATSSGHFVLVDTSLLAAQRSSQFPLPIRPKGDPLSASMFALNITFTAYRNFDGFGFWNFLRVELMPASKASGIAKLLVSGRYLAEYTDCFDYAEGRIESKFDRLRCSPLTGHHARQRPKSPHFGT